MIILSSPCFPHFSSRSRRAIATGEVAVIRYFASLRTAVSVETESEHASPGRITEATNKRPIKTFSGRKLRLAKKMSHCKWILGILASSFLSVFSSAATEKAIRQGSVELLLGTYDMNEPRFDAVYPSGGIMPGLALSVAIVSDFNLYLEAKYYSRQGELTFSKEKTNFYMIPVSLGLRYIFPLGMFNPYLGGGVDYYFFNEDNPIGTLLTSTPGYHLSGGIYFRFSQSVPLMLGLKAKYTWARTTNNDIQVQLGGLEYGVGLTLVF
jgi:hypothetical protein